MTQTERELLALLARTKELYSDIEHTRPAVQAVDNSWDEALSHLDNAISALGLGVYLATEAMTDQDGIEAGDLRRQPDGDVGPVPEDGRR